MKKDPVRMGIAAVLSPLPMFVVTILWSWFLFFGIGIGLLGLATVPDWMLYLIVLPLLVSPARCVGGVVCGIACRKEPRAWLGILLSVLGLAENVLLILGILHIGGRY